MLEILFSFLSSLRVYFRTRADIQLEVIALRHQVTVLQRKTPKPRLKAADRRLWVWLSRSTQSPTPLSPGLTLLDQRNAVSFVAVVAYLIDALSDNVSGPRPEIALDVDLRARQRKLYFFHPDRREAPRSRQSPPSLALNW
jgi:hypothetical protein